MRLFFIGQQYFLHCLYVYLCMTMKCAHKLLPFCWLLVFAFSCKKDKISSDAGVKVSFSQDSVLFDTVFTTIGSSTQNIRVRNTSKQRIRISSIYLESGNSSPFVINVDGISARAFSDIEIPANDSIYVFIQVNVNPTNSNSPLVINDGLKFVVNGNVQTLPLQAWGQDAYYHRANKSLKFRQGGFLPYSLCNEVPEAFTTSAGEIIWKNDKPHVIYGYCVVDSAQKLRIPAGTKVYLTPRSSLWVYRYGQLQVTGQKGNEVVFQNVRRETDYLDRPGEWDRIWINEGSLNNKIDYAIIKNGFIGVQAELLGTDGSVPRHLHITNTKIQNMSMWGFYGYAFSVTGGNNVFSNCLEHSVNIVMGGYYEFVQCTFANFWSKEKTREKTTLNVNNYNDLQEIPLYAYFGNCIIDGKRPNELTIDLKTTTTPTLVFSNSWLKTDLEVSDASRFINVKKDNTSLAYKDIEKYDFRPDAEQRIKGFVHPKASTAAALFPKDLEETPRNTTSVTAGAFESP